MGWKSTIDLTRQEALKLIFDQLFNVNNMSNSEIADILEKLGFGDDPTLPFVGYNFNIINE